MVNQVEEDKKKDGMTTAHVMALRGTFSKYIEELEMAPDWHRLPNGIVAYSDPIATF